jgi:mono/diheme cytochrome c family protein
MFMREAALTILLLACGIASASAQGPHLGVPANPATISALDIDVSPDGKGLPLGRGSVREGATIYAERCVMCHGEAGAGKPGDRLTGGIGTLATPHPIKTVASYWPYATTLFGYIRAAMPITNPRSLSPNEVYSLCAYLLSIDGIVPRTAVLDAKSLPTVRMPNRNGFRNVWDR